MSIKAYFTNSDGESEVRRFNIDQDVSTNLAYLQDKLKIIFPELNGAEVQIFWKGKILFTTIFGLKILLFRLKIGGNY